MNRVKVHHCTSASLLPSRRSYLAKPGACRPNPAQTHRLVSLLSNSPRTTFPAVSHGNGGSGRGGGKTGDWSGRWWDSNGHNPSGIRLSLLCLVFTCQALEAHATPNRRRGKHQTYTWSRDPDVNQYATHLTDLAWPVLQNLGFSGAVGLVCAFAFKAIGRIVAIGLGTTFAVVQLLAYGGFVTVQWSKVHEDILRMCDKDGDGQFGATDMNAAISSLLAMLSQGLPSVSGFCLGFGLGLRL